MCIPYKKKDMRESRLYDLLSKYLDHTITTEELKELRLWVNLSDDEELSLLLSYLWEKDRVMTPINKSIIKNIFVKIRKQTWKNRLMLIADKLLRAAAILLIPLLSGLLAYLYFNPVNDNRSVGELIVLADRGEKARVTLPDGSKVRLNAESSVSYKPDFGKELRKVDLKGEAFFEVVKDKDKPFVVHTEYLDVEALGTSFNVYAYEKENVIEMSLVSGRIKVTTSSSPFRTVFLNPDEKVLFYKSSGKITVEKTDNRFETAWLRGDLVFRSTRLSDVLTKIERRYGVTIYMDNNSLSNDLFTGNFDSEYIGEVMDLLKKHYGFSYNIRGDTIYVKP